MSLFKDSQKYIDDDIRYYYYYNDIITVPFGNAVLKESFYIELLLRYLKRGEQVNILIPYGILFDKKYFNIRKKIFNDYYCSKIKLIPAHLQRFKHNINTAIIHVSNRTFPKLLIDEFQLIEFLKIRSSPLFKFVDYDVYLKIIEILKILTKENIVQCSKYKEVTNFYNEIELEEFNRRSFSLSTLSEDQYKLNKYVI